MIDPVQAQTPAAPTAATTDLSAVATTTNVGAVAGVVKAVAPSSTAPSTPAAQAAQAAQAANSNSSSDAQSAPDAAQPLRLLIQHDKATNQYVYKLYDSSGRIVREIPQESLAEAQKQAAGSPGALFDTKV